MANRMQTVGRGGGGLHGDAIGVVPVAFQSVANMAPAASVAFSLLFAAPYAGGSTPLAIVVGLIACLLVAITIGQLARHLPSAGLYTYNARGLGAAIPTTHMVWGRPRASWSAGHSSWPRWWSPPAGC